MTATTDKGVTRCPFCSLCPFFCSPPPPLPLRSRPSWRHARARGRGCMSRCRRSRHNCWRTVNLSAGHVACHGGRRRTGKLIGREEEGGGRNRRNEGRAAECGVNLQGAASRRWVRDATHRDGPWMEDVLARSAGSRREARARVIKSRGRGVAVPGRGILDQMPTAMLPRHEVSGHICSPPPQRCRRLPLYVGNGGRGERPLGSMALCAPQEEAAKRGSADI